ncbi:MAG: glucose-1-phosphate adenylyltransferase [Clostridia bacterium]|nr:glucose-1-phosphate adenylyltransferase [Clostridia bacterium]
MIKKKECVAMLLAGGQGSRLYLLTQRVAKPAVSFGSKYRIIDFTLSNCINSGIDTVGVLTQYQPLALNEYIGNGQPWDLDRTFGGVMVLPPYQGQKRADWYKGTANAIYQNLHFLDKYDPDYVVVLSGDHIYKMDYSAMVDYHKRMGAACTIAVIDVPLSEASRFGIMNTYEDNRVYEFEEKPKQPKSTKASMGVYVFSKKELYKYLIADEADENSEKDFGKNIIPAMLGAGEKLYAYPFTGYWKDVGTIDSLWEANMDLLGDRPALNLNNSSWRIFARHSSNPPHFLGNGATVENSLVTGGCEIYGTVINSVLSSGVKVAKGAVVKDSVIMRDCVISENAEVNYCIMDSDTVVGVNAKVGEPMELGKGISLIGFGLDIKAGTVIPGGVKADEAFLAELEGSTEEV